MTEVSDKKVAILATHGFEQSELEVPQQKLKESGATVHVVSLKPGTIRGWDHTDWGNDVGVDAVLDEVEAADYDALVLPGGVINPDSLRTEPKAIEFIKAFHEAGKPIAAICHGPWLLAEADLLQGRRVTSYPSIQTDVKNAGGQWSDEEVVIDNTLITSRKPDDLEAFCDCIEEALADAARAA